MPRPVPEISDLNNESDVEQKFLYPVLTSEVPSGLGYEPADVLTKALLKVEIIDKGGKKKSYLPDYILVCRGLPFAVIEAKSPNEQLLDAAREARLYALEINTRYDSGINPCKYCIVSNGISTQLRSSDSDNLIVEVPFDEMISCTDSYSKFLETIGSKYASEKLKKDLNTLSNTPRFRPINGIGGSSSQNDTRPENSFGAILSSEFRSILNPSTLEDRVNIVKNAYVQSKRKERYIEDIDKLIRASTPPEIRTLPTLVDTESPVELLAKFGSIRQLESQILLLVANVGAGKSTFVDYLREVALPEEVSNKTLWLNIDLNHVPPTNEKIYDWCEDQLIEQFLKLPNNVDVESLEGLKKLFSNEYDKFRKGPGALLGADTTNYNLKLYEILSECLSDRGKYLKCLERYFCTTRGKLLVIVLDNCDKRNRNTQLLMFEVARWLQGELRTLIILPLRDTTYELHRDEPPLDAALKDLTFRIEPPLFQKVLSKRIDLILKKLAESNKDFEYNVAGKRVSFKRSHLSRYLKGMLTSLFDNQRFARRMITGLAGWDMRQAMEIFLDLCKSGYVKEDWIFDHQVLDTPFVLSEDVVMNILMRTHRTFYDGDKSRIKNVFQVDRAASRPCHFIRYWILLWLHGKVDKQGPSGIRGFHRSCDLVKEMVSFGLSHEDIVREMNYLVHAKCIIPESQEDLNTDSEELIGLTPAGHVHVQISKRVTYLSGCVEDTSTFSRELYEYALSWMGRRRHQGNSTWTETNNIAGQFAHYLADQSEQWSREQTGDSEPPEVEPSFAEVSKNAYAEMDRIHTKWQNKKEPNRRR